jgi:type VI secretion system protein VasG
MEQDVNAPPADGSPSRASRRPDADLGVGYDAGQFVRLQLGRIQKRLQDTQGVPLTFDNKVTDLIVSRCSELESGARVIDDALLTTLLRRISHAILTRTLEGKPLQRAAITVENGEFAYALD